MHGKLLTRSARELIENPSLTSLLLLEMLLLFLLSVPFLMLQQPMLMILYYVLFLFVNAVFKSGVAAMCKNVVIDGSTALREFFPGVRRYWSRFFFLFLGMGAVLFLVGSPLIFVQEYLAIFIGLSMIGSLAIMWLLFWAMQGIVFDDAPLFSAITTSVRLSVRESLTTIVALLIIMAVFLASGLFSYVMNIPYEALLPEFPQALPANIIILGVVIEIALAIVSAVSLVFSFLYTFHAYGAVRKK